MWRVPVTREPGKILFVWTVCVAPLLEPKLAAASDVVASAAVNAPTSAASRRRRRLRAVGDIRVQQGLVFIASTPDRPQEQHGGEDGQEVGRELVLAWRAQAEDGLGDPRQRPPDRPN